jgi:hypothetical protein
MLCIGWQVDGMDNGFDIEGFSCLVENARRNTTMRSPLKKMVWRKSG